MAGKYFSLHHRVLAWVGRLTNTIILLPHPVSIGNASEDYYFGLLKARREGKKLVVLFPFQMPGRFKIRMFDPAILFLESDLLAMKYRGAISSLLSGIFTLYFIMARIVHICFHKFFRIPSSGYYWRPLVGQDLIWRPNAGLIKFDWDLSRNQKWESQFSIPLELSLPRNIVTGCEVERERLGLPLDAWFVCLHVREGGYKEDWENFRNSDIRNFLGSIKEITKRGGWVVRMGDPTMTKLPALERVVDYAHSHQRCPIMDVYLLKECSFCLSASSGIVDLAYLLGKPLVMTNIPNWINGLPMRPGDLQIFHHIYSQSEDRFLSIQEWLQKVSMFSRNHDWASPDWHNVENSEEEITSVVIEMLNFSGNQGPTHLQQAFRKLHLDAVQELSKTFSFADDEVENCNEWFRFAPRMLGWRGEISAEFLEKNWFKSSRTPN